MDIFQSYHLTLLERGRALALQGKYKNAMNWQDKVLAIDPSNSLAKTDKQKALASQLHHINILLTDKNWIKFMQNNYIIVLIYCIY